MLLGRILPLIAPTSLYRPGPSIQASAWVFELVFLQNRKHLTTISVGAYKDTTGTAPKVGSELRSGDINMKGSKSDLRVGETRKKKGTHVHRAACGRTDGQMHMEHDMFSHGSRPSYLFCRCSAMDAQWTLNGRSMDATMDAQWTLRFYCMIGGMCV